MIRHFPTFLQNPNAERLQVELDTAFALPPKTAGCGNDVQGYWCDVPDNITLEMVQAVVDAHNPATLTTSQQQAIVQANAKAQAAAIPNWASWNETAALLWHDTNITNALPVANLAAANVVLSRLATENRALVRMVIALRNQLYPDLQNDG